MEETRTLTLSQTLKIPGVKQMCGMFITSCGIEYSCGGWGSTFLVEYKHMAAESAARVIMLYYVGMTLGRFLSGVLATKLHSWSIIRIGQSVLGVALVILLLPGSAYISAAGFFLVGLGNGPLFPNFNYLTPQTFGKDVSQSVIGVQMAFSYVGIMLVPLMCGLLGQWAGMWIFPVYILAFYAMMIPLIIRVKQMSKHGKTNA